MHRGAESLMLGSNDVLPIGGTPRWDEMVVTPRPFDGSSRQRHRVNRPLTFVMRPLELKYLRRPERTPTADMP